MEPVGFLTNVSSSFQFWNRLYTFEGLHSDQLPKLPKIDIDNSQIEKCYDSVNLSLSMVRLKQIILFSIFSIGSVPVGLIWLEIPK